MLLFVGLGNPTPDSENNRHNVGFKIIDSIFYFIAQLFFHIFIKLLQIFL